MWAINLLRYEDREFRRGRLLSLCLGRASEFDHTHAALDRVLKARVKNERVDYVSLKKIPRTWTRG